MIEIPTFNEEASKWRKGANVNNICRLIIGENFEILEALNCLIQHISAALSAWKEQVSKQETRHIPQENSFFYSNWSHGERGITEKHLFQGRFFIHNAGWMPATSSNTDSDTDVFLWI